MMNIENYKKKLESMSREELLNEISNLINDHGIQIQAKNTELQELKSALARADLQLQFQIGEVDLNNREIEQLKKELANERNAVITFQESANAHRLKVGEVIQQNAELQKQVDELKEENVKLKQGKAIMLDGITDLDRLVQFPVEYEGKSFEDIAELGDYIQEQAVKYTAEEILTEIVKLRKEEHGIYYSAYDYAREIGKRVRKKYGVEVE